MDEKVLTGELHRVAGALPVPAGLFPDGLLARRPRRRPAWIVAAASAAALTIFLLTPPGGRAIGAASEFFMQFSAKLIKTDKPPESEPYIDTRNLKPGDTIVRDVSAAPKQVATGLRLADLDPAVPLPTYRGPGPDAQVKRIETYRKGTDVLELTTISISWYDQGDYLHLSLVHFTEPLPADLLKRYRSGDLNVVTFYSNDPRDNVEHKAVQFKGQPATAIKVGPLWAVFWVHESGGGSLHGNIELEELLKVAESMPSLK
ncbi:MAG TPA: hypothetical protein VD969_26920 [Symbiobacteriaceae bacterium]|nr:hypothetical protein [Symbiobacteriaceae bacterium]